MGNRQLNEERLRRLWAVITALRGLPSGKARGMHLQRAIKADPYLKQFLTLVYDPRHKWCITSHEARAIAKKYPGSDPTSVESFPTINRVLDDIRGNPHLRTEAALAWVFVTRPLPRELRTVADMLLDKDLQCGLTHRIVNKVMENLGYPPYPIPAHAAVHPKLETVTPARAVADAGLVVEMYLATPDVAFGDVFWEGRKCGNLNLVIGSDMRAVVKWLKEMGCTVRNSPTHESVS